MFSDVAELTSVTKKKDAYGDLTETYSNREVFVSVRAVSKSEAYEAAAYGLKPSITFVLANREDYHDEQRVRHNGKDYHIIRTYFRDDSEQLEIVCEHLVNNAGGVR